MQYVTAGFSFQGSPARAAFARDGVEAS